MVLCSKLHSTMFADYIGFHKDSARTNKKSYAASPARLHCILDTQKTRCKRSTARPRTTMQTSNISRCSPAVLGWLIRGGRGRTTIGA